MPMPEIPTSSSTSSQTGAIAVLKQYGQSSLPPTLLATLITSLHFRPFQTLPMLFPPVLLFSSYLNVNGYPVDSAGITSAWSAAYLVLARRRKQQFGNKFNVRGAVRGATVGLCLFNMAAGGVAFILGKREEKEESA